MLTRIEEFNIQIFTEIKISIAYYYVYYI